MFTLKVVMQVISSSAPAQSMCPSQVLSNGMNFTDRVQKKYLLSIKFLTEKKREGQESQVCGQFYILQYVKCVLREYIFRNCNSLKYAAMASMPSINRTVSVVINTFLIFALFSLGVFGAVMGLLWRPGRGPAGRIII